jgi:membrane protein implicated in regulation of membrane protease activity
MKETFFWSGIALVIIGAILLVFSGESTTTSTLIAIGGLIAIAVSRCIPKAPERKSSRRRKRK